MAKKITNRPLKEFDGWDTHRRPYTSLLEWLCVDKTEDEKKQIKKELLESHTYLLIAEMGNWSPFITVLVEIYEAEQKDGLVGFLKACLKYFPEAKY